MLKIGKNANISLGGFTTEKVSHPSPERLWTRARDSRARRRAEMFTPCIDARRRSAVPTARRQVRRLGAFEHAAGVDAGLTPRIRNVGSVLIIPPTSANSRFANVVVQPKQARPAMRMGGLPRSSM